MGKAARQRIVPTRLLLLSFLAALVPAWASTENLPQFEMTNWDGRKVSNVTLMGKTTILAFTFAKCVFGCPLITYQLKELDKEMGSPANLLFLHISVNPLLDTADEIIKHFRKFEIDPRQDRRWLFLTGNEQRTASLLSDFNIEVKRKAVEGGVLTEHTIKVLVIDSLGNTVETFNTYQWEQERMTNALRSSLAGK